MTRDRHHAFARGLTAIALLFAAFFAALGALQAVSDRAHAQNLICPTSPTSGYNPSTCASNAFVANQLAVGVPISIGSTTITGGTTGRVLYDNAGVVGEYTQSQLTTQINVATSSLSGALPAWPGNTTTYFRGDGTYPTHNCASNSDAGTGCTANTGTSGATVPLNNGGFTQSGTANFTSTFQIGGTAESFPASGLLVGTTDSQSLTNKTIAFGSNTLTGVAPTASPTFTGTVTMPSGTWAAGGINNAAIGAVTPAVATVTTLTTNNNASGSIGGSLCATSAGLLLYETGVNCFAASAASITVGTTTVASGTTTRVLFDNAGVLGEYPITGSTNVVLSTSPTISGTSTSITNVGTFAQRDASAAFDVTSAYNSSSAILTAGRTLTHDVGNVAHTIKWGTTANTITFPNEGSDTVAMLGLADQTVSGGANVTTQVQSAGNLAVDFGTRPLQTIPNTGAFTITAPASLDGSIILQIVNLASAGAITWTDWSGLTPLGTPFTTADTSSSTVTVTSAAPGVVSWTAHGLKAETIVYFSNSGGALPTGLSAATEYYVCKGATLLTNSFAIATTRANAVAGTCVTTSSTGTGTQTGHQSSVFAVSAFMVNGLATATLIQQQ